MRMGLYFGLHVNHALNLIKSLFIKFIAFVLNVDTLNFTFFSKYSVIQLKAERQILRHFSENGIRMNFLTGRKMSTKQIEMAIESVDRILVVVALIFIEMRLLRSLDARFQISIRHRLFLKIIFRIIELSGGNKRPCA